MNTGASQQLLFTLRDTGMELPTNFSLSNENRIGRNEIDYKYRSATMVSDRAWFYDQVLRVGVKSS